MSTGNLPRDDEDLEAFLARQSAVSTDYGNLELVDPPAGVDEKVLAAARAAVRPPAAKSAPAAAPVQPAATPATPKPLPPKEASGPAAGGVERRKRPREPVGVEADDEAPPARRPRWLIPAALAATVLVAVGVGLNMLGDAPVDLDDGSGTGALLAKRARERNESKKAAEQAAAQAPAGEEAAAVEVEAEALPPPPMFEPEGPQVQDLDAAIALIRKELVLANQIAAAREEASGMPAAAAGKVADSVDAAAPAATTSASDIQPRDRRLTKILELFDGGNEDLAADSLEIFLRDFEDDPISQRILAVKR